ncbi:MAG: ATP-binding protein [Muribaculaceae bacterium]|nr:ATP-binding protein [Muribaculaceae bacterium]
MLKRKIDTYIQDFFKSSNKALLITGARQIGKTFSVREYGKQWKHFVEINFIENEDALLLFRSAKNTDDLLLRLSLLTKQQLEKGNTLIFFDEVQACPEVVTAIKFLVDEGSYRYILSGSLLGVELKDLRSEPVGYMGVKEMYPLDFEEFVRALGVGDAVINNVMNSWNKLQPVDEFVHNKMMELFRLYLIVGGMPEAVSKYIETNNLQEVMAVQRDIITMYKRDIAQYDPNNKLAINDIFDLIPPELDAKNKRFILKNLNENAKYDRYHNSFLWLKNAGVAIPVYNIEEPKQPLLLARSRNLLKLFMCDVGLLAAMYAEGIQMRIIRGDKDINHGSVFENVVAQELKAHGFELYYYNNKKRGEVDFVIARDGNVLPIEVKSGKDYTQHRALANIMDCKDYSLAQAIVLCNDNLRCNGKLIYAPVYMTMFLNKNESAPVEYKVDLSGIV